MLSENVIDKNEEKPEYVSSLNAIQLMRSTCVYDPNSFVHSHMEMFKILTLSQSCIFFCLSIRSTSIYFPRKVYIVITVLTCNNIKLPY